MCGIVGIVGLGIDVGGRLIRVMAEAIKKRGPDGEGFFVEDNVAMGMRRLGVIDLLHGWQPLYSRNAQVVAFQNGEIYNYGELRRDLEEEGYDFRSNSDTEVLAHGYDAWGIERLLSRVDGMYAMAILDRDGRRLFLARDRFGEKPLYYYFGNGWFGYSSDLQTLAALPGIDVDIDIMALGRYLALHFVPGRQTIFKGIHRVLPGEHLTIPLDQPSAFSNKLYFRQKLGEPYVVREDSLAELIERAVTSRLVADVPLGVFLSGGLDSSIVATIAAKACPGIATFSMGFSSAEHDESPYARQVAAAIGSRHHHFIFDSDSFVDLLPKVAAALDEPIGDQATLPLYWLCREARKHVTVALAGEGADEIFGGYSYYREFATEFGLKRYLWALLDGHPVQRTLNRLIHNAYPVSPSGFPLVTDIAGRETLIQGRMENWTDSWEAEVMAWLDTATNPLQRASAADMATWLPDDLLVKFDRMAMAHSLEGRAPFLMPALVEAAMHLPPKARIANGTSKVALRQVARRWLPSTILKRRKQGFVLPMRDWLRQWFTVHGGVSRYLAEREVPGLDMAEVSRIVESELALGVQRERLLFALVLLSEWYVASSRKRREIRARYNDPIKVNGALRLRPME